MAYVDDILALSPSGYWRLDDASGSTVTSEAGSTGTYGYETWGTPEQHTITYQDGSLLGDGTGNSVHFGGWVSGASYADDPLATECYASLPISRGTTDDFSVCMVFEHPDFSTGAYDTGRYMLALRTSGGSYLRLLWATPPSGVYNSINGTTHSASGMGVGSKHILIVTYDHSTTTVDTWLDGTKVGTSLTTLGSAYNSVRIGMTNNNGLATNYQEVAYWNNVVLSDTDISDIYQSFLAATLVNNSITIDSALGATLVSNTIELPFNVSGLEITGGYESYVESLSPRRWYKLGDYDGAYTYDYGSDGVNAEVTFTDGVVTGKVCPQSLDGGLQVVDSGYVIVQNLFNTSVYTVSFWIKGWPSTPSTTYYLFSSDNGTSAGRRVFVKDDEIQFYYSFMTSPFPLTVGKSHMVTVVSNNGTNSLYLDGRPCNVLNNTGTNTLLNAYFGANWDGTDKATNTTFDEILIFDYNLTDDEIRNLYANSFFGRISHTHNETILSLVPKAYWRLGESSGGTAEDEVGNYDLSYYPPTLGVSSLSLRDTDNTCVSTIYGIADGYTEDPLVPSYRDWSISLIVSPSTQNLFCDIISLPAEGGVNDFAIYSSTDAGHKTLNFGEPTDWGTKGADVTYTDGETYHIVVRYSGGVYEAFLNGVQLSLVASGTRTYPESGGYIYLGDSDNTVGYPFEGSMDEVAIFDYYLSDDQIQELYLTMSTTLVSDLLELQYGMIGIDYLNYLKCQWDVVDSDGNVFVDPTGKQATGIEVPT